MNWTEPRNKLIGPTIGNFKYYGSNSDSGWREIRQKKLKEKEFSCGYCGGVYKKYLICFYLSGDANNKYKTDDLECACKFCHLITHVNFGLTREVCLYRSNMDQAAIVKKTVDYIVNYDKIPKAYEIDENIKKVSLSLFELSNILVFNIGVIPDELSNLKIFMSDKFDTTFINANVNTQASMFAEEPKKKKGKKGKTAEEIEEEELFGDMIKSNVDNPLLSDEGTDIDTHTFTSVEKKAMAKIFG